MSTVILYDAHKELSDWVSLGVLGVSGVYDNSSKAIGHVKDGRLIAAVTYNNFRTRPDGSIFTLEMGIYSIDKSWATRQYLRAVFEFPFSQLGLERVSTACSAANEGVMKFNEKLGFVREGYHTGAWPMGGDSISFGMLRNQCRWIV